MPNPTASAAAGLPSSPQVAVLLLCHESPKLIAQRLSAPFFAHAEVKVYIHYDGSKSPALREELARLVPAAVKHAFVSAPVACRWGDHTLVEATRLLIALAVADSAFHASHLILISTSCAPFRPLASLQAFLRQRPGMEFIQAQDISQRRWVLDGLERERFEYYFPFNYRSHRRWFEWLTERQREFRICRRLPVGLGPIHFGSQWFCLTRATAAAVEAELRRPDVRRWLRWSWIPDEFAIQTLVAQLCPPARIAGHNLTYYEFNLNGQPLVLDNGHWPHLKAQPFFFARKIAPEAHKLQRAINEYTESPEADHAYFAEVGRATGHFRRHQAEVETGVAVQAHVGTPLDMWRGAMDTNRRRYYVLYASSNAWLQAILRTARGNGNLPIFDGPFDARTVYADGDRPHRGFGPVDKARRDHDPLSLLLELVNCDPAQPAAFGLQVLSEGRVRDFVRWDRRATLIDCSPPLSREQRAATILAENDSAEHGPMVTATLRAMAEGSAMPYDAFDEQLLTSRGCQHALLRELGPGLGDATLSALRNAYHALDPAPYFVAPNAAWREFWK